MRLRRRLTKDKHNFEQQVAPVFSFPQRSPRPRPPPLVWPVHASPLIVNITKLSKMPAIQQLSPARSHSSANRSVFDDGDSATSVTTYKMHRQERQKPNKRQRSTRLVVAVLALLVFITQFGASLSDVPSVRLLQEIICRKSYGLAPDSLVAEEKCRVDSVQSQLNVLSTGGLIFGYLPGLY